MRNVYISSNAFPKKNYDAIFPEAERLGIRHLELGSGVAHDPEARRKILEASKRFIILLHNYIPAPEKPFALNLASLDKNVRLASENLAREALEISAEIKAPFYAIHSGFAYYAKPEFLGKKQTQLEHFPVSDAEKNFLESILILAEYAEKFGVKLLIENNVVSAQSLTDGRNKSSLVAGMEDSKRLLEILGKSGVGLLLDTGHLNVSANSLGEDRLAYIEMARSYIKAFQISENDGKEDQHLPIKRNSWFMDIIKTFPDAEVTLEVNDHLEETVESLKLLTT